MPFCSLILPKPICKFCLTFVAGITIVQSDLCLNPEHMQNTQRARRVLRIDNLFGEDFGTEWVYSKSLNSEKHSQFHSAPFPISLVSSSVRYPLLSSYSLETFLLPLSEPCSEECPPRLASP